MTREDALRLLGAGSTHERLKAARFLAHNAQPSDVRTLQLARQTETVSYVRTSLELAIARLYDRSPAASPDPVDEFDVPDTLKRQIRNQAVEWVAGLLLHEIASPIGLAKRSASREISNFDSCRTKYYFDRVERIFEAIEQLKGAAAVPRSEQFDLVELLSEIVTGEAGGSRESLPTLVGPRPMMVSSDPTLIRLAISNGVRNAFEAVAAVPTAEPNSIIITWGQTDIDYWVAVLDQGAGIVGSSEAAFQIGKSTKKGHSGFGLAIARQAMETLGGSVALEPAAQGGARYEARWER